MKNSLTIYCANTTKDVFRNVEHFETLENGVSIFEVGPNTKRLLGITYDYEDSSLPLGTKIKFKADFIYFEYSETASGEYVEPKSDGGNW